MYSYSIQLAASSAQFKSRSVADILLRPVMSQSSYRTYCLDLHTSHLEKKPLLSVLSIESLSRREEMARPFCHPFNYSPSSASLLCSVIICCILPLQPLHWQCTRVPPSPSPQWHSNFIDLYQINLCMYTASYLWPRLSLGLDKRLNTTMNHRSSL